MLPYGHLFRDFLDMNCICLGIYRKLYFLDGKDELENQYMCDEDALGYLRDVKR